MVVRQVSSLSPPYWTCDIARYISRVPSPTRSHIDKEKRCNVRYLRLLACKSCGSVLGLIFLWFVAGLTSGLRAHCTKVQHVYPQGSGLPPPASCRLPSARSALSLTPTTAAYFSASSCFTCLVRPSAGLSSPLTFSYDNSACNSFSCSHKLFTLICLIFPAPCLLAMLRAAEASAYSLLAYPILRNLPLSTHTPYAESFHGQLS